MLPSSLVPRPSQSFAAPARGHFADIFRGPITFLDRMFAVNLPPTARLPVGILAGEHVLRNRLEKVVWDSGTGLMVCDAGFLFDGLRVSIYKGGGVIVSIARVFSFY